MSHENADLVRKSFAEIGVPKVWDAGKIVIIFDHRVPAESEKTATTHKAVREFVARAGHRQFLRRRPRRHLPPGAGRERPRPARHGGGGHRFPHHHARRLRRLRHRHRRHRNGRRVDRGQPVVQGARPPSASWWSGEFRPWISAKDLILHIIGKLGADGADYRAVEFDGPAIRDMSVASRMVLANLSMEMGAKVAFTPVDEKLLDYLRPRARRARSSRIRARPRRASTNASSTSTPARDVPEPQIACPHARGQRPAALGAGRRAGRPGRARQLHQRPAGGPRDRRAHRRTAARCIRARA